MSVSSFAGAAGGGYAFEGGTQLYSVNKTVATAVIPLTKLNSLTSFYIAITGTGSVTVRSYDSSNVLGAVVAEFSASSNRGGAALTLPAGSVGVHISGSYLGPIVFESIPSPLTALSITDGTAVQATFIDWATSGWQLVSGTDYLFFTRDSSSSKIILFNANTLAYSTSTTQITNTYGGFDNTVGMAYDGTTLVTTSGSTATANSGRIYTSTDMGITWTYNATTFFDQSVTSGSAGQFVKYENGRFIIHSYTNYTKLLVSTTGTAWTVTQLPVSITPMQVYYANALYMFISTGFSGSYTSSDGATWTFRNAPSTTQGLQGLVYIGGMWVGWVAGSTFYKTADPTLASWTTISNPSTYTAYSHIGYGFTVPLIYSYYGAMVSGTYYLAGQDSSGFKWIMTISSTQTLGLMNYSGSNSITWFPIPYKGSYAYVETSNSSYRKISDNSPLSGVPAATVGVGWNSLTFSTKFNRWYAISLASSTYTYWYAATAGVNGISGNWTSISSWNAAVGYYPSPLAETPNSIGFFVGAPANSPPYYYRSVDGITFTQYTLPGIGAISSGPTAKPAYKNGVLIVASSGANSANFMSSDDGLNWVYSSFAGVAFPSPPSVYSYSGGFIGITTSYVAKSSDGASWTQITYTQSLTSARVINDRLIGYYTTATPTYPWYRSPVGIIPSGTVVPFSPISMPVGNTDTHQLVQFGSGFAVIPRMDITAGSIFYTSQDLNTWTVRSISTGAKKWSTVFSSDPYLTFSLANATSFTTEVQKSTAVITIG